MAIQFAGIWNEKANMWIKGRKDLFEKIKKSLPAEYSSSTTETIWMHCASLGEFEQGRPLLEQIKKDFPHYKIVITFFSPSGYEVQKNYAGADHVFYLPADTAENAKRFIGLINPTLVLWIKYEFWFYYLHTLKEKQIPVLLISGAFRDDQPFFKWYGNFWKEMLSSFKHIFLQNRQSQILLENLHFKNTTLSGDTRFDRVIAIAENFEEVALIKEFCAGSKVVVAGSTWEDDEAELVHFAKTNKHIKFIIAPHEVDKENMVDVKKSFPNSIFFSELIKYNQQSENHKLSTVNYPLSTDNCLIIDSIGLLSRLYKYADITYVGGGFGDDGLHNILEAAVYGKPVVFGPEIERNFEAEELIECCGGITIENALELEKILNELFNNETELIRRSEAAKNYVYSNAGATEIIMNYIQENRLLTN